EVEAEQVPVAQPVVVRQSVQDRVVDGGAQHLPEGAAAEGRVVVHIAGGRAGLLDAAGGQRVQIEQVDADVGGPRELGQRPGDEAAGGPHPLDLGGGVQLDHDGPFKT